ncbi:MAG: hypothetical protein AAFY46_14120, partial [Planctomycetota bacterium]
MNAGLRLLTSATADAFQDDAMPPPDGNTIRCTISTERGVSTIDILSDSLSGTRRALVNEQAVLVDAELADVLQPEALLAWADTTVLPNIGPDVTELHLEHATGTFSLGRVGTRWGMTAPFASPVDATRMAEFIGTLA